MDTEGKDVRLPGANSTREQRRAPNQHIILYISLVRINVSKNKQTKRAFLQSVWAMWFCAGRRCPAPEDQVWGLGAVQHFSMQLGQAVPLRNNNTAVASALIKIPAISFAGGGGRGGVSGGPDSADKQEQVSPQNQSSRKVASVLPKDTQTFSA